MRLRTAMAAGMVTALLAPAAAAGQDYPAPSNPLGAPKKPAGKGKTLRVGKGKRYKTISAAVTAAKAGDTIRVANGTYREGVQIKGASKRYIKLIGNRSAPEKVVLDGKGLSGASAQNAVLVNGADSVTIDGFKARNYKANGFFLVNVNGYKATNLIAALTGTYGIYAFNSIGGEMSDSEAYYQNDGAFYIGQTPKQSKPKRSIVKNVEGWGSLFGFTGTNMRYVTIAESKFFNNGVGIVPNALSSEKFPPEEDNAIVDNDIFWNNFNFYKETPFPKRKAATGDIPYPTGVGILFLGGRRNVVQDNRIYGNYLVGATMIEALTLNERDAPVKSLEDNKFRDNAFGLNGTDRNGRDIVFEGGGKGNCFSGNTGVETVVPADGATMPACPFAGANPFLESVRTESLGYVTAEDKEAAWIRQPHATRADRIQPLETYTKSYEKTK